jgi:hypothetical protein
MRKVGPLETLSVATDVAVRIISGRVPEMASAGLGCLQILLQGLGIRCMDI